MAHNSYVSTYSGNQKISANVSNKPSAPFFKPLQTPAGNVHTNQDEIGKVGAYPLNNLINPNGILSDGPGFFKHAFPSIQRKCNRCSNEETVQKKSSSSESFEKNIHSKYATFGTVQDPFIAIREVTGSAGQRLDESTQNLMGTHFGVDFKDVKVHTGNAATKSANTINALAYTSNNNIVFNDGQYAPHTESGKRLLAHELTHVVQQSGNSQGLQRQPFTGSGYVNSNNEKSATMHPPIFAGPQISANKNSIPQVQRAMICSKRLEAPVLGKFFNHAYIDDTGRNDCLGSGLAGNYAIQTLVRGNFLKGCATKTDTSTDPQSYTPNTKPCTPKPGVTDISRCLRDAFNAYSEPSVYENPSGPNSNTFAATLASACCADSSSSGLGRVPGWGHKPAPPCVFEAIAPAPPAEPAREEPGIFQNLYNGVDRDIRRLYGVP